MKITNLSFRAGFIFLFCFSACWCGQLLADDQLTLSEKWAGEIVAVFHESESSSPPVSDRADLVKEYLASFSKLYDQGNLLAGLFMESIEDDPAQKAEWGKRNKNNKSLDLLKKLAEKDIDAQMWLGLLYRQGLSGLPKDEAEGQKWLALAAENGNPQAFEAVFFPMMMTEPEKVWSWVELMADKGSAPALNLMADQHYQSLTQVGQMRPLTPDDPQVKEALKWITRAAEKGGIQASLNLYQLYAEGQIVPKNEAEAYKWLNKAAEAGDLSARMTLGIMFFKGGPGAERDLNKAVDYYRPKAEAGDTEAQFYLGAVLAMLADVDNKEDGLGQATGWLEKAYEGGEAKAAFVLGRTYAYAFRNPKAGKEGAAADKEKAELWLSRAAEAGISEARPLLQDLRRQGSEVPASGR